MVVGPSVMYGLDTVLLTKGQEVKVVEFQEVQIFSGSDQDRQD